jgi:GT2 family glycosyltransferase
MTVAVVILNFNGSQWLRQFLPGVIAHSPGVRVVVADNASTDGSLEMLAQEFPSVDRIALTKNHGFCRGYNEALAQVTADCFVLLNSDVETTPGWLEPVISHFNANPAVAAAQPKIRSHSRREYFEYAGAAGGFIDWLGYPFCRGRVFDFLEKDEGQYNQAVPVFWATGACLFVRAGAFREAGGFDADFFAHMEEIDLCWRLRRKGYTVLAEPKSVVYHVGGGTLAVENPKKTFYNFRNGLTLLVKNLPLLRLLPVLALRGLLDGVALLRFLLSGSGRHALAVARAYGSFALHLPSTWRKRRTLAADGFIQNDPLVYSRSVVVAYFLRNRRTFTELNQ